MKKKIIILSIICLFIAIIAVVAFWEKDAENREQSYGRAKVFFSSEGIVTVTGEQVKYIDPISGQVYMLCSIPNCLHSKDDENCEANIAAKYGVIYDGKIYYFVNTYLGSEIWVKELGGSGMSKFVTIPYKNKYRHSVLLDGKFYFSVYEESELEWYGIERSGMFIVELDLKTGECRKITEEEDYEDYSINNIEIFGGALYYTYMAYMPGYFEFQIKTLEDVEIKETYRDIWVRKVDLDTLENTEYSDGENFERYELRGVSGEHLILIDNIESTIIAVDKEGNKKELAVLGQFDWMYEVIFGEYIGYQTEEKDIYIHVETGEKIERDKKIIGTVFLYNEELDTVCVVEDFNKCIYYMIKLDDYIAGNY